MRADPVRSRNGHQKTQTDGRNAQRAVRSHSHIGLSEPKRELLVIVYHMLSRRTCYADLGESVFKQRSVQAQSRRLIRQLEALGFRVTVEDREEAA